ncbi:MAG TPA: hypothetical protein VFQ80_03050 [Thermomicrobiales bacterium]|jgi:hypothetical protein|nr:hypothetical protein [Thermomicrobiales bacterium]
MSRANKTPPTRAGRVATPNVRSGHEGGAARRAADATARSLAGRRLVATAAERLFAFADPPFAGIGRAEQAAGSRHHARTPRAILVATIDNSFALASLGTPMP